MIKEEIDFLKLQRFLENKEKYRVNYTAEEK